MMNVLITRPDQRGQQLVEMLAEKQIFALHQPLFRVEAGRELPQLPAVLSRLNKGDYVFAVSKNAIDFAHETLKQTGFHWRNDLAYFAVGQRTANYFCAHSEQAVQYPIHSENSEGLLALPAMQQLSGKNVLILRAETGREFFPEQAKQRGATVQTLECYRRIMLADNLNEQISLAKRSGIDTLVVTSGEILTTLVEQTDPNDLEWLFQCRVVVVGSRLATMAARLGWQAEHIHISARADNASLLETLLKCGNFN